ncbi:uncharacterized protein LOC135821140 [Sycon ciliatum]|uniref:uncharacterized protein LOC135821140 n=1 Tax=Sycon ciliatum TaxID=27933 RepID=UPI0031F63713
MAKCRAERCASVSVFEEWIDNGDVEISPWLSATLPRSGVSAGGPGVKRYLSSRASIAGSGRWEGKHTSSSRGSSTAAMDTLSILRSSSAQPSCVRTGSAHSGGTNSSADEDRLVLHESSSEEKIEAMYEELEIARKQLNVAGTCGSALVEEVRLLKEQNEQLIKDKSQLQLDLENETKRYQQNLKQARYDMEASSQLMESDLSDSQSTVLCLREELRLAREDAATHGDAMRQMNEKVEEMEAEINANQSPSVNGNSPVRRNRLRTVRRRSFRYAGARRVPSNSSQQSDGVDTASVTTVTCEIGIQTERNDELVCKEAQCPHVERLKTKHRILIDDLREELTQTNDYAMRRRKQVCDLQDELHICQGQLQEFMNENTHLREELEDRVAQLQIYGALTPKTPGMSLQSEMDTFRYPISMVKTIPMSPARHAAAEQTLSTVSEVESIPEEVLPARSPGDGACIVQCADLHSIRESVKEIAQLRDEVQVAINKLNTIFLEHHQQDRDPLQPTTNNILFDPKQPLKTTVSLPISMRLSRRSSKSSLRTSSNCSVTSTSGGGGHELATSAAVANGGGGMSSSTAMKDGDNDEQCKQVYDMEILHLRETIRELLATAEVNAKITKNSMPATTAEPTVRSKAARRPLQKSCSMDDANMRGIAMPVQLEKLAKLQQSQHGSPPPSPRIQDKEAQEWAKLKEQQARSRFILHKAWSQMNCRSNSVSSTTSSGSTSRRRETLIPAQRSVSNQDPTCSSTQVDDKVPLSIFKYRLNSLQSELHESRSEVDTLEEQLLEAVRQKMHMQELLDDWQSDMEKVVCDRVNAQATRDAMNRKKTSKSNSRNSTPDSSPKKRRLSLAHLLSPARNSQLKAEQARRQPLRPARAFDQPENFRSTDFWALSGGDAQKPDARPALRASQHRRSPSPVTCDSPVLRRKRSGSSSTQTSIARPPSFVDPTSPQSGTPPPPLSASRRKSSGNAFTLPKFSDFRHVKR